MYPAVDPEFLAVESKGEFSSADSFCWSFLAPLSSPDLKTIQCICD